MRSPYKKESDPIITKLYEQNDMFIGINKRNEVVIDMSIQQMNILFFKNHNRQPNGVKEIDVFIKSLITKQLVERGLIAKR